MAMYGMPASRALTESERHCHRRLRPVRFVQIFLSAAMYLRNVRVL